MQITARDWLAKHGAGLSKAESLAQCSKAIGVSTDTIRRAWNRLNVRAERGSGRGPVKKQTPAGIVALGELFGRSARMKRKAMKLHATVEKLLSGELKRRQWITDTEMRERAGFSREEWTNIRRDYEDLIETASDDNNHRVTIWIHPDHKDAAMAILNQ